MKFKIDIPSGFIDDDDCEIVIHIDEAAHASAVKNEKNNKNDKGISFYNYIKSCIDTLRNAGRIRTSENYQSTFSSFRKFLKGQNVNLQEISSSLMESYQAFLIDSGVVLNTVSFYMRILRSVYLGAVRNGLIEDKHPFVKVYTGISKTAKRAISSEDIRYIHEYVTDNPSVGFARDMFLFSFYTRGMSFIDIAVLRKDDLRNGFLIYKRRKTKQLLKISWTKEMQAIVDLHPSKDGIHMLNILNQDSPIPLREQLRQKQASINYHLKKLGKELGIKGVLTMYVARHSWASIAKQMNIPLNVISDGMGHTSEKTTQVYLTTIDADRIDAANEEIIHSVIGSGK
jgi:integrase